MSTKSNQKLIQKWTDSANKKVAKLLKERQHYKKLGDERYVEYLDKQIAEIDRQLGTKIFKIGKKMSKKRRCKK